ncbi:DUF4199 domain-containing protein [Balneola sp. MJW-20]|uniref:DUF4199 domain-containing protein n=1 Tax=Gracilimonas aurantiaca TaxID=3234185 RepID=UPI00390C330C
MKKYMTEIKWGLIFVVTALVWMMFEKAMGWHGDNIEKHATMTNLFAIIAIAVYILALRDKKRNDLNGNMSWTQGFMSGMIITAVVFVLSPVSQWITHTLISPEYFPNIIDYSLQQGYYEERAGAEAYFSLTSYIIQAAIGALLMGSLTSAIVAFFMKSKSPDISSETE